MVRYCSEADKGLIAERWVGRSSGKPSLNLMLIAGPVSVPRGAGSDRPAVFLWEKLGASSPSSWSTHWGA